jgi:23S rRNA (guanosine2251-2'-O)-methyltransferase
MLICGLIPLRAALTLRPGDARKIFLADTRTPSPVILEILALAEKNSLPVERTGRQTLDRLCPGNHQGAAAFFRRPAFPAWSEFLQNLPPVGPGLILALDHVEDPHNLGALWRSAAAFGALALVVPQDRTAPLTPAVLKAAAGGAEAVPRIQTVTLARALEELKKKDFWVVGAEAGEGAGVGSFRFPARTVLLLGSEGRGLGRLIKEKADFLVSIPLAPGPVDSLNVSVAGAILLQACHSQILAPLSGPPPAGPPDQPAA